MKLVCFALLYFAVHDIVTVQTSGEVICTDNCVDEHGEHKKWSSCKDVKQDGKGSGIYTIYPDGSTPIEVYCDQKADKGGWTVIQRRVSDEVNFYRNWTEYQSGFGDLKENFWIGLENLFLLTKSQQYMLRVDLMIYFYDQVAFAEYDTFYINGADDNYRLTVSGYNGTAGDSMKNNNGMQFSTYDNDNDLASWYSCAERYHGGWWYGEISDSNPNGVYRHGPKSSINIFWETWKGPMALKRVEMKIRQKQK